MYGSNPRSIRSSAVYVSPMVPILQVSQSAFCFLPFGRSRIPMECDCAKCKCIMQVKIVPTWYIYFAVEYDYFSALYTLGDFLSELLG